ncbi:sorting nexin lst-4 isoform X1 [Bacillus rossius redtenbacheri]|uniref:sorting nexin lst-4 isoform X1 n=1 Tax=Bacillus rossius redtenbacheri TaxID=93214 RepID=UPI002FDDC5A5
MVLLQVRALYDFSGEPNTAELSISAGEVLTVTRQDVGEGWWEGINSVGKTGLFPAAYVEEFDSKPPAIPAPVLSEAFTAPDNKTQDWSAENDTWDNHNYQQQVSQQSVDTGDYWDDEWDDDSEGGNTQTAHGNNTAYALERGISKSGSAGDVSVLGRFDGAKGTIGRKSFNRFTAFVKSGGESYILGTLKANVKDADKVYIFECEDGIIWNPITEPYTCIVASPKKETKLKGLKSFIAYQITPSFNNIQVSRRYKHFDWLHERLEEKFSLIPIPPLPDKQISGRYEEHFIEHRRVQLQAFVDSVCRHPVLSRCEVWQHFMTCTDEKRWKAGKRRAEKDELVGANFFTALQAPEKSLEISFIEYETDKCSKFIHGMDGAVKNLMATGVDQTKKHQGPYKREFQKIGQAFLMFGQAAEIDSAGSQSGKLAEAVKATGEAYHLIGKLFEDQPKMDWEPLGDILHLYKGIISSFPDILTVHKGALQKRKECERLSSDHRMDASQLVEVNRRTDVLSYALLAEINHFHCVQTSDFREAMQKFLQAQIIFYEKIVGKLKETLEVYDQ